MKSVAFETRSGTLVVDRGATDATPCRCRPIRSARYEEEDGFAQQIGDALGTAPPDEIHKGRYVLALWNDPKIVRGLKGCGNIAAVLRPLDMWGLIATAPGDEGYDFISRFFAPDKGVPEDPVTGSAHCALTPFWAKRLGKKTMKARQVSPRGGDLTLHR